MIRTHLKSLILLNWKGLFYHRFDLHERVTALEGQNGAGKTTVMIGAYVALLPDLNKLRFTNVGEHGATGGDRGIYGRLGEPGRPTYTVLEVWLPDGTRLLCGVQLVRKSAPSLELTPFLVTGLSWNVSPQDVLLERGAVDSIPELDGLRLNVARFGGKLVLFPSAKEYFAALFDYGVTPMRLVSDDERDKFNEVLRTSMVGGISRALGGELRSFLLKEESGLADALKQMRSNLDSCRSTRREVKEAEQTETQIHSILEAGQEMFAAAIHALRSRAKELRKLWEDARRQYETAHEQLESLQAQAQRAKELHEKAEQTYQELTQHRDDLRTRVGRLRKRCELDRLLEHYQLACAEKQEIAVDAMRIRQDAEGDRERCRSRDQSARNAEGDAAQGLAKIRKGLEVWQHRAAIYRLACEALERVQAAHPVDAIPIAELPDLERHCKAETVSFDGELVRIERRIQTSAQHAEAYARISAALDVLGSCFTNAQERAPANRHAAAQQLLRALRELDCLIGEIPTLAVQLQEARARSEAQNRAQVAAAALSTTSSRLVCAADVFAEKQQVEQKHDAATRELHERESEISRFTEEHQRALSRSKILEQQEHLYRQIRVQADEISKEWEQPIHSSSDADLLRVRLDEKYLVLERDTDAAERELQSLREEIRSTEQGGLLSEKLRSICGRLDGQLLVERFEDVPLDEAGRLQARLGPLYEAILVEDVPGAVTQLSSLDRGQRPDTVWLVDSSADLHSVLESESLSSTDRDVLIPSTVGHRFTKIPERPVLGARARMRRVSELRGQEQRVSDRLLDFGSDSEQLKAGRDHVAALLRQSSVLDRGDPLAELDSVRQEIVRVDDVLIVIRGHLVVLRRDIQTLKERQQQLSKLCESAHLLDLPDQEQEAQILALRLERAQQAQKRIAQFTSQRQTVETELETLRLEPLSAEERSRLEEEKSRLETLRDDKARVLQDLRFLGENSAALGWTDAGNALVQQTQESSLLEAQYEQARRDSMQAAAAKDLAERRFEQAMKESLQAESALDSAKERLSKLQEDHVAQGGGDTSAEVAAQTLQQHEETLMDVDRRIPDSEKRKSELLAEQAGLAERLRSQSDSVKRLFEAASKAEGVARPEQERCERIEKQAQAVGVLAAAMAERYANKFSGQGAVNLWGVLHQQRVLLCERLRQMQEGTELSQQVERLFSVDNEQSSGEAALEGWLRVRGFLLRCMPAQIAEANDPEIALSRLRDHLRRLEKKLADQEVRLRGNSQDVAQNIEQQVRKARKQVTQLNRDLAMVRFGSIVGVQIRVVSVERMERVLRALKDGAAQTLLFQTDMPLEDALDEIFRNYGGGKTGGHRLLDYREYLELVVQIQRQSGTDWEPVNATKMSTGEAIGVGAAVMMVILTAWERDANLLRQKRAAGTLRLLFLDEATRLSRDSLDVLFDLCEGLELQLLIAAPEVANAKGNIAHHMVRTLVQGREEVRVTARRAVEPPPEEKEAVHVA